MLPTFTTLLPHTLGAEGGPGVGKVMRKKHYLRVTPLARLFLAACHEHLRQSLTPRIGVHENIADIGCHRYGPTPQLEMANRQTRGSDRSGMRLLYYIM